jgi:hypothetical protein
MLKFSNVAMVRNFEVMFEIFHVMEIDSIEIFCTADHYFTQLLI